MHNMTTYHITIKRGPFGGYIVYLADGHKTYIVIITGSHVSITCQYYARPANWRCRSETVMVRRELHEGPTHTRITAAARDALSRLPNKGM